MIYRRGKKPAENDPRNFRFRHLYRGRIGDSLVTDYDVDALYPGTPLLTLCNAPDPNDPNAPLLGDCVEVGKLNWLMRATRIAGNPVVPANADAQANYLRETDGGDDGLSLTASLKDFRKHGVVIGGQAYKIGGFAEVDWNDYAAITAAITTPGMGILMGAVVDDEDEKNFDAGIPWSNALYDDSGGGHCMWCGAFNEQGLRPETWGKIIQTMQSWDARIDEMFVLWPVGHPAIDQDLHERLLRAVA